MELIKLEAFKEKTIMAVAKDIATDIESGNTRPLPAYVQAKALEALAKEVIKLVKDQAIEEAETFGKDDSVFNGAKFSVSTGSTLLNYDDDEEYRTIKKQLDERQKKLKKSYDMKTKDNAMYVDAGTGETIPVVSVKKHGEQIIKVSFK